MSARIGAEHGERSPDRLTYRNGYRSRAWDTRVGTMELRIPKLREGSYFPSLLEPRRRSERLLPGGTPRREPGVAYLRQLDRVVDSFLDRMDGGPYCYIWLDALSQKVREEGRIVNVRGCGDRGER